LRGRGVDPNAFRHSTVFLDNSDTRANEFLREKIGVAALNKIYQDQIPVGLWGTRYLKDGDAEEYFVVLRTDGALHSIHHSIAEGANGASLSKEEAVAIAEKYLRDEKKLDLAGWSPVDSNSKKQPHRTDHTLVWQQTAALDPASESMGHAYARVEVKVLGNEVTDYRKFVKIPDDWARQQKEKDNSRLLYFIGSILVYVAIGGAMIAIFLKNFRSDDARSIPWRRITGWALWSLASYLVVILFGDRLAEVLQQYNTAVPLKAFYAVTGIGLLLGAAFAVAALVFAFGLAWFFCRRAFGEERLPSWTKMPGVYYRDALLVGICGVAAFAGIEGALGWVAAHNPMAHRAIGAAFGDELAAKWPALSTLGASVSHALMFTALTAAIGGFIAAYVKPLWLRIPLFFVAGATLVKDWGSAGDYAQKYLLNCVLLAAVVFGVRWIAKLNLLGIFLVLASSALLSGALSFVGQANGFYRGNGYAILGALALLYAWPMAKWLTGPAPQDTQPREPVP